MAEENQDFEVFAGDDAVLEITVLDEDGAAQNLSGATIAWKCARRPGGTAVLSKSSPASGVTITSAAGGVFQVTLPDSDTDDLLGDYWHQAVVTDAGGTEVTVTTGTLRVKPRIA